MDFQTYRKNREKFSDDELRPFDGKWVAFTGDGKRIVAGEACLEKLREMVVAAGENPEEVGYERIVIGNGAWQGAAMEFD